MSSRVGAAASIGSLVRSGHHRSGRRGVRLSVPRAAHASVLTLLLVCACALEPGERVGRVPAGDGAVRIGVPELPVSLDPALARTAVDQAVAAALFATLVSRGADGTTHAGLARAWVLEEERRVLRLELAAAARFSDGSPLTAHDVVWSWQRALRATTGALDKSPFDVFADGRALVQGLLLRAGEESVLAQAPFSWFDPRATSSRVAPSHDRLALGARVRVVDSNARRPCCGEDVPLLAATAIGEEAVATLAPSDVARVLAVRVVDGKVWLRLRHPDGRAGWAARERVSIVVPPVAVRRVVERGDGSLALRAGPDADAPVRDVLRDDDTIELLEPGAEFALVLDARTGRAGYLRSDVIDEVLGERWWLEVEREGAVEGADNNAGARGWMTASALVFDPSLLAARALDASTLEIDLAPDADVAAALQSLSAPLLAPVPARRVDEGGYAWAEPARIVTSGAFRLGTVSESELHLVRTTAPTRVLLVRERDPIAALHRFRAGDLDALWDGLLPRELLPTLSRARDFVPGPLGGALAAPELRGFSTTDIALELLRFEDAR